MPIKRLQFSEWLPDQPAIGQGLQDAKNVVPVAAGYSPFPSISTLSGTASENLNNVFVGKVGDTVNVIAGGDTKLFKLNATTSALEDVSKLYSTSSASAYNGNSRWKFVQYGSSIIGTDYAAPLQTWTVGSSTNFETLGRYISGTYTRGASGNTAVTTTVNHGLTIGNTYTFDFTSGAAANGSFAISNAVISNIARTSGTSTITTSVAHGYVVGHTVTVNSATDASFNGTFTVATVPTGTTFTYSQTSANRTITNVARTSNVSTITTSVAHGYSVGFSVTVTATTNTGFNGTFTITGVPTPTTFTYAQTATDVTSTADTGSVILANVTSTSSSGSVYNTKAFMITNSTGSTSGNVRIYTTVAPASKYLAVVRDFVVAANLVDAPNKLYWSDINDETNWESGAASQSDFQIIADGGTIQGITGGEFGIILLEKAIYRMQYIGSPYFFQFDAISRNIGCPEGNSVINSNGITYFLSDDGFYMCDGRTVTPIGAEKVDKYFYSNFDVTKSDTMSAAIDPARKLVVWNYPTVDGIRELLIYNWQLQKWTRAETTTDYLAQNSVAASSGTTLEGLNSQYLVNAGSLVINKNYAIASVGTTDFTVGASTVSAGSFVVGRIYYITSLGTTTNTQWNTIAGTSGITYTVGMTFTAATTGASSGTGQARLGAFANTVGLKFTATTVGSGTGTAIDLAAAQAAGKTLDTLSTSLDSRIYSAGKFVFAGINTNYIVTFTGANTTANLVMSDIEEGYNAVATLARPLIDNGGANISIASRRELDDDISFTTPVSSGEANRVPLRSAGRFHRLSVTPTGNWTTAVAVDLTLEPQGGR